MSLNALLGQAQSAVAEGVVTDMTQVVKGGGDFKPWPAGPVLARLVHVIELGNRAVSFKGEAKPPAPHIQLGFALFSPNHSNEDGTPGIIRTMDMTLSQNEKSKTHLLFKRMNYRGTAKHFAELLGNEYILTITHTPNKDATKQPYANIDLASIGAPVDPMSQQFYQVPAAPDNYYKLFMWNRPTKEQWDSLFITAEKDDDGKSKNWQQDKLLEALDFSGSALEAMLFGSAGMPVPGAAQAQAPATPVAPTAPLGTPAAAAPAGPAAVNVPWTENAPAVPQAPAVPAAVPAAPVVAQPTPVAVPAVPAVPQAPALPQ